MAAAPRSVVMTLRTSPETKAAFEALAASRGKSVSGLLDEIMNTLVVQNPVAAAKEAGDNSPSERITLRLRPGDRELLNARAAQRGMKAASYGAMLVRAHVRGRAPLPIGELNALKVAVGELSAIGRNLNQFARAANSRESSGSLRDTLRQVQEQVAEVRESVAALVRENLMSWEAGDG